MNISQIALYPKIDTLSSEQNKKGEIGMLDLVKTKRIGSCLCALPFKFMGYSRFSIKHALRAKIGQGDVR